jgi:hypothetical protein
MEIFLVLKSALETRFKVFKLELRVKSMKAESSTFQRKLFSVAIIFDSKDLEMKAREASFLLL